MFVLFMLIKTPFLTEQLSLILIKRFHRKMDFDKNTKFIDKFNSYFNIPIFNYSINLVNMTFILEEKLIQIIYCFNFIRYFISHFYCYSVTHFYFNSSLLMMISNS
jgi:hypothetical protein